MKFLPYVFILVALGGCASCAYDEKRKVETVLEQSVDRFHDQLNRQEYHDIYSQSDRTLQSRISEIEFTNQLNNAHDQLGTISGKAIVIIDDNVWRDMHLRRVFGSKRQSFTHHETAGSDLVYAIEKFVWAIDNDQPRLTAYEFRSVCRKPCTVGFGP